MKSKIKDDFRKILLEHFDALSDRRRFKSILKDFFPKKSELPIVNAILAAYDEKISQELQQLNDLSSAHFLVKRYTDKIVNAYAISEEITKKAVELWIDCFPVNEINRLKKNPQYS